jgi:hypothetical protein
MSRLRKFAQQHLGVKWMGDMDQTHLFRNDILDVLDAYYENRQYDDLQDWEQALESNPYVPIRKRKPRIIYNLPKAIVNKVASKLVGSATFPNFVVEEDDDDTAFFRTVAKGCKFKSAMMQPVKRALAAGSVLVVYNIVNGSIQIEHFLSKYSYPTFDEADDLQEVYIQYVYEDWSDLDAKGDPKKKWYKIQYGKMVNILFDNPEYRSGVKPTFNIASQVEHGLGWVMAEWFCTEKEKHNHDGVSIYGDILDLCDDINYSLSQSSQAVGYGQEPQLGINGMDEDELDSLIKSSQKAWNLGKDGKAAYIETKMDGVTTASEQRDKFKGLALDVARVVMHDPDKISGAAQSGDALEQLNAPLVELVDELRQIFEPHFISLLTKIAMTCLVLNASGQETVIETPPGYTPKSVDITTQWPPIFPPTLADIQMAAGAAQQLSQGQIISRKSLTRWIAQMIPSIDNVDEELEEIDSQEPLPSPFGSFGEPGGGM